MKIVHLSMTPVAGACWAWSESFKEAGYDSYCIARSAYGDGRVMPKDSDWPPSPRAMCRIQEADLIFCHQGKPYRMAWYPRRTPTVNIYHSQPTPNHSYRAAEKDGWPWAAVGQWEARLFENAVAVPNLVPLRHPWYQLGNKSDGGRILIAYSPSNKGMTGWDDKGYEPTVAILKRLQQDAQVPVSLDIITGTPLEECLARKAKAHIIIDEVMTGAYHRNSLEGMAMGSVVVNNCDSICAQHIRDMTGGADHRFVLAKIGNLYATLQALIEKLPAELIRLGKLNRLWMERHWSSDALIERNFIPLMDAAFRNAQ